MAYEDKTKSLNLATLGSQISIPSGQNATLGIQVRGDGVGYALKPQASMDSGTTWIDVEIYPTGAGAATTSAKNITANGNWEFAFAGFANFRLVNTIAAASGSVMVYLNANQASKGGGGAASRVSIDSLDAGDDEVNNWKRVVEAGLQGVDVLPIQTPAGPMPNSSVPLGSNPKIGVLLDTLNFTIRDPLNAAVYLEDGLAVDVLGGVTGTAPTADSSTITLTTPLAFTATQNQYADCILWVTYTPINAGRTIKFMRRIVSHPAYATSGTTFVPTLTHNIPAGATIIGWGIRPIDSAWELRSYNQTGAEMHYHRQSQKSEGFRLSVDKGVFVPLNGQFN